MPGKKKMIIEIRIMIIDVIGKKWVSLARSRFRRFEECNILLSKLASEDDLHLLTFYE